MEGFVIGKTIDGRFKVLEQIGKGGIATVYLALDERKGTECALKIVTISDRDQSDSLARLSREFRLCQQVDHPNVIKLLHFGVIDNRTCYTVMELIEGPDLSQLLQLEGRLDSELVLHLAKGLASVLQALHDKNIVHRDLKPANIMLVENEELDGVEKWRPVIMDFGLARGVNMTKLTETGTVLGTPYYMSPELASGEKADKLSDIFQFGAISYELLTGKRPFDARTIGKLLGQIISETPPLPTDVRPDLPKKWDEIIEKCMEKDPSFRYSSASQLLENLEKFKDKLEPDRSPAQLPPKKVRKAPENKTPLALTVVGILFLILSVFFLFPRQENTSFSCMNLSLQAKLTTITAKWSSHTPYPSVLEVLSADGARRFIEDEKKEARKNHHLLIKGLQEGKSYKIRVIYPSGETSLAKSVATKRFKCILLAARAKGLGFEFAWSTEPKATWHQLLVKKSNRVEKIPSAKQTALKSILLPTLSSDIDEIELLSHFDHGVTKRQNIRQIVLKESEHIRSQVTTFQGQRIINLLAKEAWLTPSMTVRRTASRSINLADKRASQLAEDKETEEKRRKMRLVVKKELAGQEKEMRQFKKLASWSTLVLSSRLLSLAERKEIDKIFDPYLALYSFCVYEHLEDVLWAVSNRGDYSLNKQAAIGEASELILFSAPKKKSIDLGIAVPFKYAARETWTTQFIAPSLAGISKAELKFQFRRFDNTSMRVRMNGKTDIQTFGHRGYAAEGRHIWQRIPVDSLKEGENELELHYVKTAEGYLDARIRIRKIILRLVK